jgi:hypothetical protein
MRTMRVLIVGMVLASIGILSGIVQDVRDAQAIPAFARKYDLACNVCHVPGFPKLNDFGNVFRDQGYQFGTDQDLPEFEAIGKGFWPVSFRTTVGYQAADLRTDGRDITTGGFGFTFLDIMSFGTLTRDVAFGIIFVPQVTGNFFGTNRQGPSDLPFAYVRLMRLEEKFFGMKSNQGDYLMNLKVGRFALDAPFDEPRSPTLNTIIAMYHYRPGSPFTVTLGGTPTRSYPNPDSFGMGIFGEQGGVELSGIKRTDVTGGYFRYALTGFTTNLFSGPVSGCPAGATCGGGRNFDFYGHITQSFGGYGIVTGQRVGIFGAYGGAPTQANPVCPTCLGTAGNSQPFYRVGGDVSLTYDGQWNLFGAGMHANDSKNLFVSQGIANAQNATWNGALVELDWYPTMLPVFNMPGWLFGYRFDLIRNERQGDPTFAKSFNDVDSHTAFARWYIHQSHRTDIALHLEYNWYRSKGVGVGGGDLLGQTSLVGLDFAF